jgi:oligopeptide/dipeptide ABC transporter ATP-binding protein
MVKYISDRIGVMYLGKMMELADSGELYKNPLHPYTKAIFSAIPSADPRFEKTRQRILLKGAVPSPINPPAGCRFSGRCRDCMPECREKEPLFSEVSPGHFCACHLHLIDNSTRQKFSV